MKVVHDNQITISEQLISICSAPILIETRQRAAIHVLDWLGCIYSGAMTAPGTGIQNLSSIGQFGPGDSFVCGQQSLSASGAAFINGGLGNILEMDDVHRASIMHAGDVIIPAVLAMAQEQKITLGHMLDSIVRGYEIALRLGVLASSGGYSNWYNSGTCGVFGAALGCGHVLGLNSEQLKNCLGQAGMLGSGIWQCRLEPTWSKQLATANAASNGVLAAYLGQQNFPGASLIFEGEAGFFPAYYPDAIIADINLEPVDHWLLHEVSFKPWSACRHNHPAIEAALQLYDQHEVSDIVSIDIETYRAAIDFCDNAMPSSDHDARFSLQHCVAVSLLRGEPSLSDFEEGSRNDKSIVELRNKMTLTVGQGFDSRFPQQMGSALTVRFRNGECVTVSVENAKGDPENPMQLDEIKKKFTTLATVAGISESSATGVISVLSDKSEKKPNVCVGSPESDSDSGSDNYSLTDLNSALTATVKDMQQDYI